MWICGLHVFGWNEWKFPLWGWGWGLIFDMRIEGVFGVR